MYFFKFSVKETWNVNASTKMAASAQSDGENNISKESSISHSERMAVKKYDSNDLNYPKKSKHFRNVYGRYLCILLVVAVLTIVTGTTLLLSGIYSKVESEISIQSKSRNSSKIDKYNKELIYLRKLRISGVALLAVGAFCLILLIVTPIVCLGKSERHEIAEKSVIPCTSKAKESIVIPKRYSPNFHYTVSKYNIQPKAKTPKHYRRLHDSGYDRGYLSPELNRGPIFVSDHLGGMSDRRIRSASWEPSWTRNAHSDNTVEHSGPDFEKISVKEGSYHSLQ